MSAGLSIGRKCSLSISCGIHLVVIMAAAVIGHQFVYQPVIQAETEVLIPLETEITPTAPLAEQASSAALGQSGSAAPAAKLTEKKKMPLERPKTPQRETVPLKAGIAAPVSDLQAEASDSADDGIIEAASVVSSGADNNGSKAAAVNGENSDGSGDTQGMPDRGNGGSGNDDRAGEPGGRGNAERTQLDMQSIINRFASRVERNKEYPYMAVRRGQTGIVNVYVGLSADGSLEQVSVSGSSGVKSLDDSAVKAVRASCPYEHGAGRSLQMTIPIHYELKG